MSDGTRCQMSKCESRRSVKIFFAEIRTVIRSKENIARYQMFICKPVDSNLKFMTIFWHFQEKSWLR